MKTMRPYLVVAAAVLVALSWLASCSSSKHVPQGQYLLDKVDIDIEGGARDDINYSTLVNYLRQTENHKVLGGLKLQLAIYNLSGSDTTRWFNRWVRRIGAPPVIYDSVLTVASAHQLQRALINKGYLKNEVDYTVKLNDKKRKARVGYHITLGEPYYLRSIAYDIADDTLRALVLADTASLPVKTGDLLDHNKLDAARTLIMQRLRNRGYFAFNKQYISFIADTAASSRAVDLTLTVANPSHNERLPYLDTHRTFVMRHVTFVTNYDAVAMQSSYYGTDTTSYNGLTIYYGDDRYINAHTLDESCHLRPGATYSVADVDRTYKSLGRLGILKFINIEVVPVGEIGGVAMLDAYVLLTRDKSQSVSLSLEGTNSEGDLGFGVGVNYQHRNTFKGSETLNVKFKANYESISGDVSGLINDNYSEYQGEVGLTFPKFKAPFLRENFKRRIQASTEFSTRFNYQARPEYTRIIAGAAWKYIWSERSNQLRHTFNLIDLNYVYLPHSRGGFLDSIANPLLRYSYEDHFIMRIGYSYYKTNKINASPLITQRQNNIYTLRASVETAGNLLYGISRMTGQRHEEDDSYKVFGIRYSQYAKAEGDFSFTHYFDNRQSIAFHVGAGIAVPYGNSSVLPFEKRFYAGGANSVRGWGVRTLGPGSFNTSKSQSSFIYQCGDVRLDASVEYRAKLFWVIELGLFVDAGNIWTIRDYPDQLGGVFKFDKFYEQIALGYGLGLRMDFTYFLLRLDMGMKAHNPASGQKAWPLFSPNFKRDAEFHFSVGYPF